MPKKQTNTFKDCQTTDSASEEEKVEGFTQILREIREFRHETTRNFEVVKKDISEIKKKIKELDSRLEEAESRIAAKEDQEIMLSKVLIHTLRVQKDLMERCEDSEGRSRRKNLRIYAVPEKLEGSDMIGFVEKVLRHTLKIEGEIPIERAHRSGQLIQRNNNKPRSILVRFQSYNTRQRVLSAAWAKKEIKLEDNTRIYFDEDFTNKVFQERAKYRDVRKQLKERGIKARVLFPARLKITEAGGKVRVFRDPRHAAEGLRDYGVAMEMTPREPDLESMLKASGWETAPSRRANPAKEMLSGVKTLLDAIKKHEDGDEEEEEEEARGKTKRSRRGDTRK